MTSLSLSCLDYPQDEFAHIQIKKGDENVPLEVSLKKYDGPEERFCPAHVYEYVKMEDGKVQFQIHSENCLHCKTCVVKTPQQFLSWNVLLQEDPITQTCNCFSGYSYIAGTLFVLISK